MERAIFTGMPATIAKALAAENTLPDLLVAVFQLLGFRIGNQQWLN
jgi:hypothetical protein